MKWHRFLHQQHVGRLENKKEYRKLDHAYSVTVRHGTQPTKTMGKNEKRDRNLLILTSEGSNLGGMLFDGCQVRRNKWMQQNL